MTTSLALVPRTSLLPYFLTPETAPAQQAAVAGLAPWQANSVVRMMLSQLAARISTTALARECGLSRGHFSRAFKQTFGLPPHSWRHVQRIALAKTMLAEDRHALTDIAAQCGFSDQAHFTRAFKADTGTTPLAWRRQAMTATLSVNAKDVRTAMPSSYA
ncbi:AraC family transcriptional regulator [Pseudoxanthomonas sp. GM95]|uniref:helix-turn-helix domain-containing protein n=1 Tax=Pseudoxanthomonas sp. GM95 TaxID=1881043 RepID=UPI0008C54D30|nr:AraC family transcriptional regulator [Pseudoxanthomonas sp. GM95]SEL10112.1 AraC family transcriptional regulator [Pseudoxanthomonas sp. GM95]